MFKQLIISLTDKLLPLGRAFRHPKGGISDKMTTAIAEVENEAYSDAVGVLNSILPDNPNFTTEDATTWERRLGLITNINISLADRMLAIKRKYNHPGTIKARQHYLYMERELRAAGFAVRVTENRYPASPTISEQMGISEMGVAEMGGNLPNPDKYEVIDIRSLSDGRSDMGTAEMGVAEMGGSIDYSLVANYIDESLDKNFFATLQDFPPTEMGVGEMGAGEMGGTFTYLQGMRSTFFIHGETINDMAQILTYRKDEFRQLILRIKPVQTIAVLLVNYTIFAQSADFNEDFNEDFAI